MSGSSDPSAAALPEHTAAQVSAVLLRESEARFEAAFHGSPDAMVINRTRDGLIVEVNRPYERFFGYRREELVGRSAIDLGLIADPVLRGVFVERLLRDGRVENMPWLSRTRSGEVKHTLQSGYLIELGGEQHHVAIIRDLTDAIASDIALRQSEERLQQAVRVAHIGMFDHDHQAGGLYCSPELRAFYGWEAQEEITVARFLDCVHDEDRERIREAVHRSLDPTGDGSFDVEHRILRRDGQVRWITTRARTSFAGEGGGRRPVRTVGAAADVTERRQVEQVLRIAAAAFESNEGRIITDANGRILQVNRAFQELTGFSAQEAIGRSPSLMRSGRHGIDFYRALWLALVAHGRWQGEIWNRRRNGQEFPAWVSITAVRDPAHATTHYVAHYVDISEQKAAQEQIRTLAFFDALTRLPNRRFLIERLQRVLDASARSGRYCAAMFIDLDHFKNLNDTRGHAAGDALLLEVARRLQGAMRAEDVVARLGGDEFVVVLDDLSSDREGAAARSEAIAAHLLQILRGPCNLTGRTIVNTASIGICVFRGDEDRLEDVLKRADTAMYQAKSCGRDTARFFDPRMHAALEERALIEAQLRQALERREFSLHYQVQVDREGGVIGAEALLRWAQPEAGTIAPARFIPVAEETGIILPIGRWVLETACAQLRQWQADSNMRHVSLAVNVSARQFAEPGFVAEMKEMVGRYAIPPGRLKIELTESLLVRNIEEAIGKMHALQAAGIVFSMDDFGTGHSSLNYLKRLPLGQIKIDQSFVRDIAIDPSDATIVRAIISMGKTLGMQVIAEGVETHSQLQLLKSYGCNAFQGYLFGRPAPAEGFATRVRQMAREAPATQPLLEAAARLDG